MRTRRAERTFSAALEPLEERQCLASSVGWDGPEQGAASLTYTIGRAPSSLSQAAVETALETALGAWAAVADVTFTRTTQPGRRDSIDFTFTRIDGAGRALAQAYFPDDVNSARIAGDVRFDSSDRWEVGNGLGGAAFDLVLTAVHEIGHALGLEHSSAAGSVMAPSISPNQTFRGLAQADVNSIRALYAPSDSSANGSTDPAGSDPTAGNPLVPRFDGFPRSGRPRRSGARANNLA
jgi:hypothetical protein